MWGPSPCCSSTADGRLDRWPPQWCKLQDWQTQARPRQTKQQSVVRCSQSPVSARWVPNHNFEWATYLATTCQQTMQWCTSTLNLQYPTYGSLAQECDVRKQRA
eukprot:gnl/MRDRNA2_/MRDRNA2_80750_c0_seq1.p1 gnl/MRDRNA2_/MRDRNA2_80750_c0~~gnl/MRDRNA2_/MRDRNA2_80750_c0_seq1.p1  ORF type:complete len:104 (-),score=4.67 gnl/MRDRNA2_/MRDRNA2_80750_c0_seq1:73-384(-)